MKDLNGVIWLEGLGVEKLQLESGLFVLKDFSSKVGLFGVMLIEGLKEGYLA